VTRNYHTLLQFPTFEERFEYLKLSGRVGDKTFGFDRWINQNFYTSSQWKHVRQQVIARDLGMDLACEGYEIYDKIIIHHMDPMTAEDIAEGRESILDPEYLICTTHRTHNAIHYGDESLLVKPLVERRPGDTKLWGR
jgi:hypothetical protein